MGAPALICVIDDDADYRLILQLLLKHHCPAYPVRFFASAKAFFEELPQLKPSLILLDRHMPELDGHQTLLVLKQHPAYKRIPVLMMSAHATREEIDGCYEAGANSFLSKGLAGRSFQDSLSSVCQYWLEVNQRPSEGQLA